MTQTKPELEIRTTQGIANDYTNTFKATILNKDDYVAERMFEEMLHKKFATLSSVEAVINWHEDERLKFENRVKNKWMGVVIWYQEEKAKGIDITPMQLAQEIDKQLGWQNK